MIGNGGQVPPFLFSDFKAVMWSCPGCLYFQHVFT